MVSRYLYSFTSEFSNFINKGFKAYLKPSEGDEFYDLLIGPYVNKSDLSKDQEAIRKITQEKSSIVDYSY